MTGAVTPVFNIWDIRIEIFSAGINKELNSSMRFIAHSFKNSTDYIS